MTDPAELKPIARLPPLPTEVFADPGRHGWYFRDKKPDSVARYVRDDLIRALPAADTSALGAEAINEELNTPESVAFWNWLPLAYRDGHVGERPKFTKYNMEVSHLAGWQHALKSLEPHTHADLLAAALALPEVAALRLVLSDLAKYAKWQIDEGRYYHPTLPSAVAQARAALAALEARHDQD